MGDLISREAAVAIMQAKGEMAMGTPANVFYCAAHMLEMMPAVDAVEVVRCKDCVYACDRPPFPTTSKLKADCWCAINDHLMSLDDFCSRGETAAMKDSRDAAEQDAHEQLCSLGNPEDGSL